MMWTDEYDRVDDGHYLHDPGMPLEVWIGELLGPDPIESKPELHIHPGCLKAIKGFGMVGCGEWEEKEVHWSKDEQGHWQSKENPYHPKVLKHLKKKALLEAEANLLLKEKLPEHAEKSVAFFDLAEDVTPLSPGKLIQFSQFDQYSKAQYTLPLGTITKKDIEEFVEHLYTNSKYGITKEEAKVKAAEKLAQEGYQVVSGPSGEDIFQKDQGQYVAEKWKPKWLPKAG